MLDRLILIYYQTKDVLWIKCVNLCGCCITVKTYLSEYEFFGSSSIIFLSYNLWSVCDTKKKKIDIKSERLFDYLFQPENMSRWEIYEIFTKKCNFWYFCAIPLKWCMNRTVLLIFRNVEFIDCVQINNNYIQYVVL